jgi:hypothetical protein
VIASFIPLGAVVALLAAAALWWALSHGLARASGWKHLSRAYPYRVDEEVGACPARPARLRRVPYPWGIRLHVGETFLGLSTFRLAAGHRRISIPWGDVEARRAGGDSVALTFGRAPRTPLVVESDVAAQVDRLSGGRLAIEADAPSRKPS